MSQQKTWLFNAVVAVMAMLSAGCATDAAYTSVSADPIQRIVIAGDSTAADYPPARAPQTGWGQALPYFLKPSIEVRNLAVNGRSTKSYIDEGRWDALSAEIGPGDLVLISFGHNDSRDDAPERYAPASGAFRENLKRFARDVYEAGAYPVILSPIARRLWEGPAMVETHGLYALNAGVAAHEAGADFIDLSNLSLTYFEPFGEAETKADFFWITRPHWRTGAMTTYEDNTHLSFLGACGAAFVIAGQLAQLERGQALIDEEKRAFDQGEAGKRPQAVLACEGAIRANSLMQGAHSTQK